MRERDPEVSEGRLVRLLVLDIGNGCLDERGGVEGGVETVALILVRAGKGEGAASRETGVGVDGLTSSSTSMWTSSFASGF